MNKCEEYPELISAYADGELSEPEMMHIKEHLDSCENCSAILELYRGISAAVAESSVRAPGHHVGQKGG